MCPNIFWDRLRRYITIAQDPEMLPLACAMAWRTYVVAVSPAVTAFDWPVETQRLRYGETARPWTFFDESKVWRVGDVDKCVCGCGMPGDPFYETATMAHEMVFRRRFCRLLMLEVAPSQIPKEAMDLVRTHDHRLVSDDEHQLYETLHKRDPDLFGLPSEARVPIPAKGSKFGPERATNPRDRGALRDRKGRKLSHGGRISKRNRLRAIGMGQSE